jgi:hypothetical protein
LKKMTKIKIPLPFEKGGRARVRGFSNNICNINNFPPSPLFQRGEFELIGTACSTQGVEEVVIRIPRD